MRGTRDSAVKDATARGVAFYRTMEVQRAAGGSEAFRHRQRVHGGNGYKTFEYVEDDP